MVETRQMDAGAFHQKTRVPVEKRDFRVRTLKIRLIDTYVSVVMSHTVFPRILNYSFFEGVECRKKYFSKNCPFIEGNVNNCLIRWG